MDTKAVILALGIAGILFSSIVTVFRFDHEERMKSYELCINNSYGQPVMVYRDTKNNLHCKLIKEVEVAKGE